MPNGNGWPGGCLGGKNKAAYEACFGGIAGIGSHRDPYATYPKGPDMDISAAQRKGSGRGRSSCSQTTEPSTSWGSGRRRTSCSQTTELPASWMETSNGGTKADVSPREFDGSYAIDS